MLAFAMLEAAAADDAPGCDTTSPSARAEELRNVLASGEYERAVDAARAAEQAFPCLTAFVTAEDLASLYQLSGTAAWFSAQRAEAPALFRRAATVAPAVPFDASNLGAEAAAAYAEARSAVAAGPMGVLVARGPAVIDGTAVRPGSRLVVPAGLHLIQEAIEGGVRSARLTVEPGVQLDVGTADPAVIAAEAALLRRRHTNAWLRTGVLSALASGLYAAALVQEAALLDLDPQITPNPESRARAAQIGTNLAFSGALLSLAGAGAFAWQGLTLPDVPATTATP